ncbi:beta-glucosidase [Acrasis kona]|uniref:Beta-glucosidase n=1 Tax=Acrasis kona TaxID=1008807 RepID=A0AAW2YU41_9EUKA
MIASDPPTMFDFHGLSMEDRIAQMLLFGWQKDEASDNYSYNSHLKYIVEDLHVGGVIIMKRNAKSKNQLHEVIENIQNHRKEGSPPLFISVDQEGGRVSALEQAQFSPIPSALHIGKQGDTKSAFDIATAVSSELQSVGINWNFAPVLDVNNNPDNPVIGDRSYGDDPDKVAEMGIATLKGYQHSNKVLACGKHFPGHGDTNVDSHLGLPIINHDLSRLQKIELVPFKKAIDHGLQAIMTSHILFTQLDKTLPATVSKSIITNLLRQQLRFDGVVITDCMEMKGLADTVDLSEAAVLAVLAGVDILLCCHTLSTQQQIYNSLIKAVQNGRITEERIDESLSRIYKLKKWLA